MWRQLKPKKNSYLTQSKKMLEAAKIEEEKKKAQESRLKEQAEERRRRAGSRDPSLTNPQTDLPTTQPTNPSIETSGLPPAIPPTTLPVEMMTSTSSSIPDPGMLATATNADLEVIHQGKGKEADDELKRVVFNVSDDEDSGESLSTDGGEGRKKKKKGKGSKKKMKKAKSKKGKDSTDLTTSPSSSEGQKNRREMYGGLIEHDHIGMSDQRGEIPEARGQLTPLEPLEGKREETAHISKHLDDRPLVDRMTEAINNSDMDMIMILRNEMVKEEQLKALKKEVGKLEKVEKRKKIGKEKKGKSVKRAKRTHKKSKSKKKKKYSSSSSSGSSSSSHRSTSSSSSSSMDSSSSNTSSSNSDSSDSSRSTSESENGEDLLTKANVEFEFTAMQGLDLPDLPDHWDKCFRKMKRYVPLSVFKRSYIDAHHSSIEDGLSKKKHGYNLATSERILERQMTYGDFIRACDLEARYASEIYGHDAYAEYIKKHKEVVNSLMDLHKCWMIGLRYHLAIRALIFRKCSRIMYKKKKNGKKGGKVERVVLPDGVQALAVRRARWDAETAGDLKFEDNPYAPGQKKFGYDFYTGEPVTKATPVAGSSKAVVEGQAVDHDGLWKKKRGGNRGKFYKNGFYHQQRPYPQPKPAYGGHYQGPQGIGMMAPSYQTHMQPYPHYNTYVGQGGHDWVTQGFQHANKQSMNQKGKGKGHENNAW
ncbi:hypothetical protein DFH28DRAFT_1182610 [Melampsora americana]|nr:hypothetical protein DFH28DRAFT_1182610 [Melampsora americana]